MKTGLKYPELVVISDTHLGTFGCHANKLLEYLYSIQPQILVLNGDIIDIWQFRKKYFPKTHLAVIKRIIELNALGTRVVYLTGNHDEMLRKFSGTQLGNFEISNKLVLDLDGKKAWFFHGDIFDVSIKNAKWIASLGAIGYSLLIHLNRLLNWILVKCGKNRYSLSNKIKHRVKNAREFINNFEKAASDLAIDKGYKYVVCGHIHQPKMIRKTNVKGTCLYLNSGDWIENFSALEYKNKKWELVFPTAEESKQTRLNFLTALTVFGNKKPKI